jgi:hypothetical protein
MSIRLQIEQMPGYLAARFIGSGAPGEVTERFESIVEHCNLTKNNKLLINTTAYDVKASVTDRFFLGTSSQIFAVHRIKVAFVCRQEQLDPRKFGVLVAQNRGVNLDAFADLQSAEEWLLK